MPNLILRHTQTKEINGWVEKKTRDKIKDLIKPDMLDAQTVFVLINAIYFKAKWKYQFKKSKTRRKLFYTKSKSKKGLQPKKVQMMDLTETFEFADLSSLQSTMLRLPYEGERIVLDILLPKTKTNTKTWSSLGDLEKSLEEADIQANFEKNKHRTKVHVKLPRFKIESKHELNDILEKMGMTDMFFPGKADFRGMIPKSISVSKVTLFAIHLKNNKS